LALALLCQPARSDDVLTVEAVSGHASVERVGQRSDLKPGDALTERDLVRTHADSRMSLRFPHNGFAELGPDTVLAVEKLPFASFATDLKSIFTLSQGYLRLVWKRPAESTPWPVYVFFGGQRAAITSGEFFFDARPGSARVCVAAGQINAVAVGGANSENLKGPACYRLAAGREPDNAPTDPERWIAVRRNFSLDAPSSAEAELAATETAPTDSSPSAPAPDTTASSPSASRPPTQTSPSAPAPAPVRNSASVAGATAAPPASAPSTAALAPGDWVINVASYPDPGTAAAQVEQLRAAGYAFSVRPATVKGRTWYRVQMTSFPSQEAARAKADEIQVRLGFKSLWIIRAP